MKTTAEFSAACTEATAGNPFLLAEVLRTLRADETTPEDVEALTPAWKLAYVARLLRSMAMIYGLRITEFHRDPSHLGVDEDSVAALVHGINDLVHLPTALRDR